MYYSVQLFFYLNFLLLSEFLGLYFSGGNNCLELMFYVQMWCYLLSYYHRLYWDCNGLYNAGLLMARLVSLTNIRRVYNFKLLKSTRGYFKSILIFGDGALKLFVLNFIYKAQIK